MKTLTPLTKTNFKQYQTENMDPALALIGDGLSKKGLRDQMAARLLGYKAFEAISFESPEQAKTPSIPCIDLRGRHTPTSKVHAHLGETKSPADVTLHANAFLLSILPVMEDQQTPYHPNSWGMFEAVMAGSGGRDVRDGGADYPGIKKSNSEHSYGALKLLHDTESVPEALLQHTTREFDREADKMIVNQHYLNSLQELNATVLKAWSDHLSRTASIEHTVHGQMTENRRRSLL
jgi:hypothetical protein